MQKFHPIIYQLNKLKESSKEAVADAKVEMEDELKAYLHVERAVERNLKKIIKSSFEASESKLILVCGNVGDGKSHLLSRLNVDTDLSGVIEQFNIHNDATESFSPDETCIDTLTALLQPFSNENINDSSDKWILAINLGTLSNFLEDKGNDFTKLKEFIETHKIISADEFEVEDHYIDGSSFQFVNFTNYHFFELTPNGVKLTLLEELLFKIVNDSSDNPIYQAYKSLKNLEWANECPVKENFEFLLNKKNREVIANLLVECILKEKLIISFRQILNFVYDLIVPYELSIIDIESYKIKVKSLSYPKRLEYHLVNFLFERPQLSKIFQSIFKLDPAIRRYEELDSVAITLFTSTDSVKVFDDHVLDLSPYIRRIVVSIKEGHESLFKLLLRLKYFEGFDSPLYHDDHFVDFTKALFFYNIKDSLGLKEINQLVKSAVLLWNGSTLERNKMMYNNISKQSTYRFFRNIELKVAILPIKEKRELITLNQFLTEIKVAFLVVDAEQPLKNNSFSVNIDYSLYILLKKVIAGYRPNKLNRHSFINFVSMVENLIYADSEQENLFIDEVNIGNHLDYKLSMDEYGLFEFTKL